MKASELRKLPLYKDSSTIWKDLNSLADQIEAAHEEEKWRIVGSLRLQTNNFVQCVSEALSDDAPTSITVWSRAKKSLFSAQTLYTFASQRKLIKIDPDFVLQMDSLLDTITEQIIDTQKLIDSQNKVEE